MKKAPIKKLIVEIVTVEDRIGDLTFNRKSENIQINCFTQRSKSLAYLWNIKLTKKVSRTHFFYVIYCEFL